MYGLHEEPDKKAQLKNGADVEPVATLSDEYGGRSHIIIDDGCYVLINGSEDRGFGMVKHWYPEAVEALKRLPSNSDKDFKIGKDSSGDSRNPDEPCGNESRISVQMGNLSSNIEVYGGLKEALLSKADPVLRQNECSSVDPREEVKESSYMAEKLRKLNRRINNINDDLSIIIEKIDL